MALVLVFPAAEIFEPKEVEVDNEAVLSTVSLACDVGRYGEAGGGREVKPSQNKNQVLFLTVRHIVRTTAREA